MLSFFLDFKCMKYDLLIPSLKKHLVLLTNLSGQFNVLQTLLSRAVHLLIKRSTSNPRRFFNMLSNLAYLCYIPHRNRKQLITFLPAANIRQQFLS